MNTHEQPTLHPARQRLASHGYTDIEPTRTETADTCVYRATRDGYRYVIKSSKTEAHGVDRIKNETEANRFLRANVSTPGLLIPDSTFFKDAGFSFLVSHEIEGEAIAVSAPEGMEEDLSETDVQALVDFLLSTRSISEASIPHYFQDVADHHWNKAFYAGRLSQNAQGPLKNELLTAESFGCFERMWAQGYGARTFQHHDLVPFNLLRTADGLALLDSEFARIGMVGYDIAYFTLQTACLLNRPKTAVALLEGALAAWSKRFPEDNIEAAIFAPLAYRYIASLNDAPSLHDRGVQARTLAFGTLIANGNMAKIIEELKSWA